MTIEPKPPPMAPRGDEFNADAASSPTDAGSASQPPVIKLDESMFDTDQIERVDLFSHIASLDAIDEPDAESQVAAGDVAAGDDAAISDPAATPTPTSTPEKSSGTRVLLGIMALLVLAVPILAYVGFTKLGNSTRGTTLSGRAKSTDPGFEALVDSTPTALLVLTDHEGNPAGLTLLSLSGAGNKGGAIVALPLGTRVTKSRYGQRTFREIASNGSVQSIADNIAAQLSISFADEFSMTPDTLAALIAPVGALTIENPMDVVGPDSTEFAKGSLTLEPAAVPTYLLAKGEGESVEAALERSELVWRAWLAKVHEGRADPAIVPGESGVGIGRFVRGLSAGKVAFGVLPTRDAEPIADQATFTIDDKLARLMLTNAVPFPTAAARQRLSVRVLNGTGATAIPQSVMQRIVFAGGQISILGNGADFDVKTTTFTYSSKADKAKVQEMARTLGKGKLVRTPADDGGSSVTVILGSDVLEDVPPMLTPEDL